METIKSIAKDFINGISRNYFKLSGRATRQEYWVFTLIACISIFEPYGILPLLLYIPSITVSVRRLHDFNQSGWWVLLLIALSFATEIVVIDIYYESYWSTLFSGNIPELTTPTLIVISILFYYNLFLLA